MAGTVENLPISAWLSELHMECYKKNLEDFDTIRPLLDLKEPDLKKLGIQNSKDRARMLGSLASYKSVKEDTSPTPCNATPVQTVTESHKSLLRKSSLKKITLKGFLGSGGSKKSKKSKTEAVVISPPSSAVVLDQISSPIIRPQLAVQSKAMSELADYEELPSPPPRSMTMSATTKPFHSVALKAIENEYVPSPENSPRFDAHRQRSNTVNTWDYNAGQNAVPTISSNSSNHTVGGAVGVASSQNPTPEVRYHQQQSLPQVGQPNLRHSSEDDNSSPGLKNRHLSAISMESGLSFGYDVEKDFNPSFPLENQPWYHGRISRADAEALLHDDGDFLVRENIMVLNTHTLSLRWRGKPDHTLIGTTEVVSTSDLTRATGFKYHFDGGAFDTIPELIFNHLKYQIPIEKNQHTLITNPICRPGLGAKSGNGGGQAPGIFMTMFGSSHLNALPHNPLSHSIVDAPASTLPRNFGSSARLSATTAPKRGGTTSPEAKLQLGPRINFSPRHSAHSAPLGELKSYGSSGDLLDVASCAKEDVDVQMRNVISPPPVGSDREHALTISHTSLGRSSATSSASGSRASPVVGSLSPKVSPAHKKMDSFGDYEHMESVSILNGTSHLGLVQLPSTTSLDSQGSSSSGTLTTSVRSTTGDRVKYAEIVYPMNANGSRGGPLFVQDSKSVKYAEIHFPHGNGAPPPPPPAAAAAPHPFSVYDTVPPPRKHPSPYQSRAELLAQKMHDYATPNPLAGKREVPSHSDSSPHPFSQYPASASLPRSGSASNYVQVTFGTPRSGTTVRSQASSASQGDSVMYALLEKARRKKDRDSTASNDSALSTGSAHSGSPAPSSHLSSRKGSPKVQSSGSHSHTQHKQLANVHSHVPEAKVHKNLPGYTLLVKVHTVLQSHNNEELVYHLTRADATCFMLAPRPGEDAKVWKDRVKQWTSSSGQFYGLQTLADPDGEKLWKKLYYRHLNLAQTVSLCIVTAGDAMERARLLHRFIEVASLLQSGKYGNLFSFIAVMQGMAIPQVKGMSEVWDLLNQHFPDAASTHKDLMSVIGNIKNGVAMYSTEQLTIPAIQHLKAVFHFSEQPIPGFPIAEEDLSLLGEYSSLCTGLDGVRDIVANTSFFSYNARRRLDGLRYDANLMDFFMQDTIRLYLQSISVHVDDPVERRRRFGVLLDALVMRVNSSESV